MLTDNSLDSPDSATVGEVAYRRIRSDIVLGRLTPGRRLPLERMKEAYGTSVSTLRELFSRLATEGLLVAEGARGFQVTAVSAANLREVASMRLLLEGHGLKESFQRGDLEWEGRVVAAYHKLSKAEELVVQDADSHADLLETYNRQFHGALISGCNSRWLLHFHGLMYDQSLRYRMLAFRVKDFPRDQSRREHKQILDAALAREVETLVAVLGTHITKGAEMYAEHEAGEERKVRRKAK